MKNFISFIVTIIFFLSFLCSSTVLNAQCHSDGNSYDGSTVVISMSDSYGDGWDGASLDVCQGGTTTNETFTSGYSKTVTLNLSAGENYSIHYNSGSFEYEHSYTVTVDGTQVYSSGTTPTTGNILHGSSGQCHSDGNSYDGSTVVILMSDSYGDGWDGASLDVCQGGTTTNETFTSGYSKTVTLNLSANETYSIHYNSGSFEYEHSYTVTVDGTQVYSSGTTPTTGNILHGTNITAPIPSISSFTPTTVCSTGGTVTITGTNFTGSTAVTVGGSNVSSFTVNSETQITAVTGSTSGGIIEVTNVNGSGSSGSSLKTSSPVVSAAISADVICDGGSINLTGSYSDNVTYTDVATPSVTTTQYPFRSGDYDDIRQETLILASDLTAMGFSAESTDFSALAFNVMSTGTNPSHANFTIKLKNVARSSWTATTAAETGCTTVFGPRTFAPWRTGWFTFAFDQKFTWDGTSNILIQMCVDNVTNSANTTLQGYYTGGVNRSNYRRRNNTDGCTMSLNAGSGNYVMDYVMITRWTGSPTASPTYSWTSDVGGFSSSSQNPTGITPTENTQYTLTATNSFGCTGSSMTSVAISPTNVSATVDAASSADICSGETVALVASATSTAKTENQVLTDNGNSYYWPFVQSYTDSRTEMIYTASELTTAGFNAGDFTSISFYVESSWGNLAPMENMKIFLKETSSSTLGDGTSFSTGMTEVFSGSLVTDGGGNWTKIDFTTPFTWDGTSNLIVQMYFDNTTFTDDQVVAWEDYDGSDLANRSITVASDDATASSLTPSNADAAGALPNRPVVKFGQTSQPAMTYEWSIDGGTTTMTTGASATSDPLATSETITLTVTDANSCESTTTAAVNVTPAPNAGTLTGTESICSGGSTTFTSDGDAGTWSSASTGVATINSSTGVVTPVSSGSSVMTYTVTGTGGCSDATATRTATVTTAPNAGTLTGTESICSGGSTTFSSDGDAGVWSSASTGVATINSSTGVVTPVSSGSSVMTYTVTGTGGCSDATATRTATVTTAPNAGTLTGTESICSGGSTTFSSDGDAGAWSSASTGVATINSSTGVVTPVSAGTSVMTYTVTGTGGCSDATATRTATVTAQPSISGQPSNGADVCIGSTPSTMSVTATGGSGSYTYQWYSNTSDSNSGGSSIGSATNSTYVPDASIAGTTYYYCVVSDAQSGCNDATSNTASQTITSISAGTVAVSDDYIVAGNDITWTYTGSDFDSYEYQWNSDGWNAPWTSNNPQTWGSSWTGNIGQTLYVRAKVACGSESAYSNTVSTYWDNCYTEPITATVDGVSISDGGDFTINSTVVWTWPHGGTGANNGATDEGGGTGHALGYAWETAPSNNDDYLYAWAPPGPTSWTDFAGGQFTSTDRILYVKSRATGVSSCTNYSQPFSITLKRPVITTTGSLSGFTVCAGSASSSQSFSVSGSYISNSTGITVTAPTGFEVSTDDSNFSGTVNVSATSGNVSSTPIYVRLASTASGSPSGNVTCSATSAVDQTVSASGTASAVPTIITATDLTAAANTCGETELTISHSGTGGNGQWTYSGGLVSYNNSNATDATINVTPQPSDVNTDITMTWTVGAGEVCDGAIATKTIRFNQPTSISSPDTYCYLWGGLTSADNATGSNWYKWDATKSMWARQSAAPSASTDKLHVLTTDNTCIHASNTVTLGTTTLASLNVGSGATMSLGSGTVTLNGDLTNAGTINEGSGTVSLTAAGDQTLSGGGTTNFNNLTLNKTSDNLVLSSPATIKGTLTMNKGNINNGSNILTIGESSASPGAITHNSGSVTGKLRRYFADASSSSKYFPIGNASTTRDVTVSFGSTPGSNQFLTASYNAGYPQLSGADLYAGLPLTTADGQLIQNYDDEGYWEISPGSTATGTADSYSADINSAAYNLTIHMNGLTGDNAASMDRNKVRIIKSAGPSHTSWVALTHGSISGSTNSDYTVTASGSGFSFFGAGTDDGNALPVELVSFNGVCNDGIVDLVWQTASEQNSEDFEVAYSRDGVDWKTIHTEPAAGFSNTLITYDYTHEGAVSGNNYYRLTQNDIDGASVVYDNLILNANCQATSEGYFSVFPNPSSGTFQVIMNNESLKGAANINMVDTKGNIVFTKPIEVNSGINMYVIQELLSPGIYYIHIDNGTMRTTVVKHSIR